MMSPLAGIAKTATSSDAPLTLREHSPPPILQVAGWDDFETAVQPLITSLGFEDLGGYRIAQSSGGTHLMRLAPDRIWLIGREPLDVSTDNKPGDQLTTLDVTHGRWIIDISGPGLEDLLARLAPIDVRERNMPAGAFAQTAIHKTSLLIWRRASDNAQIFCPTSSAHALWSFITDTAAPLGYRVAE